VSISETQAPETGTARVKRGMAEQLKGGVIMDVVTPEQAKIAEDAGAVAEVTREYQEQMPELADKFRQYDVFAPEFPLSCLNRLQLRDNRQMVDLTDPSGALQLVGSLRNPIAGL